ncbi:uncharacterized protein LOC116253703 isoform X2 [Nymphaea colorata]|uniref:uncharacterized protein LOC116253703 isoform X2 n=1 Tax=Nymphaea colorata TaxID=210225 RepID=UPI00129EE457|nr:uncharacterized protein LOC116253703 isoform X2 [Nymphaea colorata]
MAGVHLMALAPRVHLSSSAPSRLGRTALMVSASSLQNHRPLLLQQQHLRSPDLVELEYADLKLKEKVGEVGHVRIRQHVNPLSASFSTSPEIPNWDGVFEDPKLPLMVDIGSGSGRFLMWLAKKHPQSRNYLGLEIREKLVKRAQFWVKELSLKNICFQGAGFCLPRSFNCPDPHFKKRHHKRRVLQKPLVDSILESLVPGGQVFMQSDVLEVAHEMRDQFDACSSIFKHIDIINPDIPCDSEGWILSNPMGIRTEREIHAESEGAKIYRRMYQKI